MKASHKKIQITQLSLESLENLSQKAKLALSGKDMLAIQKLYKKWNREPTDVELEVIAQTWSEHCKHRIFGADILHKVEGKEEKIQGLFKSYIREPSEKIFAKKKGFVLSAFHDNAGFIRLDEKFAVCLKVETHNHPSAVEPYSGSSTGVGGVVRDILGAGKGAKPVASLDVFCFGDLKEDREKTDSAGIIHPLGIMRGVVRGVRDYGNRMGIPTVCGAIQFDKKYLYNPLVFCGTAGVIPIKDIDKKVSPLLKVVVAGARTGKDGLKGATFSSASLSEDTEGSSAIQVGVPIEEKKLLDFILKAREKGLIECLTDCGAGGFSSSAGEMLSDLGGDLFLENALLKEEGMSSWEIFLSESQERMVLAVRDENLQDLEKLANSFQTEIAVLGEVKDSGILNVSHYGEKVCHLNLSDLHEAPTLNLFSSSLGLLEDSSVLSFSSQMEDDAQNCDLLHRMLADPAIASKEVVIRQYDHTVQGNTVLPPLAGASGISPQDGSVLAIPEAGNKGIALAVSLLPEWGKVAYTMGQASVDEVLRQLTVLGANPEKVGLLDNFCMGDPYDEKELGVLVECVKGMSNAAMAYETPFISGKDSFYNFYEGEDEKVNIPMTFLCSGIGIVDSLSMLTGNSLRRKDSLLCLLGETQGKLGCSVLARVFEEKNLASPRVFSEKYMPYYLAYHQALKQNLILSAHDISEGGLIVSAVEMAFSGVGGIELNLNSIPLADNSQMNPVFLYDESPGRILMEVEESKISQLKKIFADYPFSVIGKSTEEKILKISEISSPISSLEKSWRDGLNKLYQGK